MHTTSVAVQNLCVPCENRCRYCLLSYDGRLRGVDYDRSEKYAARFYDRIRKSRPELSFQFYFGYSMEHPRLLDSIDFMRSIGSAGGEFLQLDGMKFRSDAQTAALMSDLKARGIRAVDLTFYGTREYHDRFAARSGDFDFMISMLECACRAGLSAIADVPLTKENVSQADELIGLFRKYPLERLSLFVPHSEGRGAALDSVRLTLSDYENLSDAAKKHFNRSRLRTQREWILENKLPHWEKRAVTVSLTPENIDLLESQPFEETIAAIEALDDEYHAAVPAVDRLASICGDPESDAFYNPRDLIRNWQRRYIRENGLNLYDIHDERQHFVRRF